MNAGLDGLNEDELFAAVLEISKREASFSLSHDEEKPTNSPDTGFGDDEMQELPENLEPMDVEKPKAAVDSGESRKVKSLSSFYRMLKCKDSIQRKGRRWVEN